ncbi:hypothetical protein [Paenibacillus tepidiphilus]|uniref:hypothetical protein n=1 Tax=Paenibacillus tepidiphilus TaxID=2608683 RepID=UPI00123AA497|nr:hypothetical protein [Paenibacillus tepidiphilus]
MGRTSISQKLRKASSDERRVELAHQWAEEWRSEYETHVRNFERAIRNEDHDLLVRTLGWLKADGIKRYDALPRVMAAIASAPSKETEEI